MELRTELLLNKYGQGIVDISELILIFNNYNILNKKEFLNELLFMIQQSKPLETDVEIAISNSKLRSTYTPCVLLKKGIDMNNLTKIINLPEDELEKVFILLTELFKIGYNRRFFLERNDPNKWWYWDLTDKNNIDKILEKNKG
jgi:hypothetical protein